MVKPSNYHTNLSAEFIQGMNQRTDFIKGLLCKERIWGNERWELYLRESHDCYIFGQYVASILTATSAIEICLASVLVQKWIPTVEKKSDSGEIKYSGPDADTFFRLLKDAKRHSLIESSLYKKLDKLGKLRTNYVHGIDNKTNLRSTLGEMNWREILIMENSAGIHSSSLYTNQSLEKDSKEVQIVLSEFVKKTSQWISDVLLNVEEGNTRMYFPINIDHIKK
jgi:hypothetical protein